MQEMPFEEYEKKVRFFLENTSLLDVRENLKAPESQYVIRLLHHSGFSIVDASRIIKLTSETLDEDYACKEQAALWLKYKPL